MMESSEEMTRDMRRRIRRKLKDDLIKVQGLSSKVEARELQLRQSQSVTVHPSTSDAQFSASNGSPIRSEFVLNKHKIPSKPESSRKASLERKNLPPLVKSNTVYDNQNRQETQKNDEGPSPMKSNTPFNSQNQQEIRKEEGNPRRKPLAMLNEYRLQCRNILKKLMGHADGWIFNEPVNAVKLGLSDYHTIIKKPMDLGTIKTKLEKKQYTSISEFADDVKLTFKNAMTYNPQGNDVHQSAVELLSIFQKDWDVLQVKWERGGQETQLNPVNKKVPDTVHAGRSGKDGSPMDKNVPPSKKAIQETPKRSSSKPKTLPAKHKAVQPIPKSLAAKPKPINKSEASDKPKAALKPEIAKGDAPSTPKGTVKPAASTKSKPSGKPKTPAKREMPAKPKATANQKASHKNSAAKVSKTPKSNEARKAMSYEEKVGLQATLRQLPQQTLEELILLMKERNVNMSQEGDEIEVDLDSFDDDTLWELDRRAKACLRDIQTSSENKKRPMGDDQNQNISKKQKVERVPIVPSGNKSSSGSDSSSDSDSGSSSGSDSDR